MSKLLIELKNGADGEIELLDNKFIEFWKMVFVKQNSQFRFREPDRFIGQVNQYGRIEGLEEIYNNDEVIQQRKQDCITKVNTGIDGLQELNIPWSRGRLDMNLTREDLNRLHRGFTTLSFTRLWTDHIDMTPQQIDIFKKRYLNMNAGNSWPDQFYHKKLEYEIPKNQRPDLSYDEINRSWDCLHEINAYIHKIEDRCLFSPRKKQLIQFHHTYHNCQAAMRPEMDWDAKLVDGITDSTTMDWNFESALNQAFDSVQPAIDQECNVFDLKNILGKDYQTCYRDHDNPINLDITNTVGTTKGGFEINDSYNSLHNTILKPWLDSYGFDNHIAMYYPLPIGRLDKRFIEDHYCIKGGWDNGEIIKERYIPKEDVFEMSQDRQLVKAELIQ